MPRVSIETRRRAAAILAMLGLLAQLAWSGQPVAFTAGPHLSIEVCSAAGLVPLEPSSPAGDGGSSQEHCRFCLVAAAAPLATILAPAVLSYGLVDAAARRSAAPERAASWTRPPGRAPPLV